MPPENLSHIFHPGVSAAEFNQKWTRKLADVLEKMPPAPDLFTMYCQRLAEAVAKQRHNIVLDAIKAKIGAAEADALKLEDFAARLEGYTFKWGDGGTLMLFDRLPLLVIYPTVQAHSPTGEVAIHTPHKTFPV